MFSIMQWDFKIHFYSPVRRVFRNVGTSPPEWTWLMSSSLKLLGYLSYLSWNANKCVASSINLVHEYFIFALRKAYFTFEKKPAQNKTRCLLQEKTNNNSQKKKIPQFTTFHIFLLVVIFWKWIDVTANLQKDQRK